MKKLLLFAVAALMASTVSAQSLGTKPTGKAVQQKHFPAMNQAKKMATTTIMPMKATVSRDNAQPRTAKATTLNVSKLQGAKATGRLKLSAAPRKASSALASYVGTCSDNKGEAQVWTMVPCTVIDDLGLESPGFQDMVPNPFTAAGVENIYVYYFDLDGTLIVPAQPVTTLTFNDGSENSIWITNYSSDSEDGSIPLTLEGDGTLKMETDYVAYVGLPVDATEFSFDDMEWYWSYYKNIKYQDPNNIPTPEPSYTYDNLVLFSSITPSGYSFRYQHVMTPAYAPVNTINNTMDVTDAWDWKTYALTWDETAGEEGTYVKGEVLASGTERAFSYVTNPDYLYAPTELVASYGELTSEPFADADNEDYMPLVYAGALGQNWVFDSGDAPLVSRANLKWVEDGYSLTGFNTDGIKSFILYQGKPTAPFYFEGINMIWNGLNVEENFNLKCKIQKVDRTSGKLVMGEVIAESEVDLNNIIITDDGFCQLQWNNFQAEDEMGFKSDLPYIFVEDEFAIVIEGLDNGTFTGTPIGDMGAPTGKTNTYVVLSEEDEFSGYGYQTYYGHVLAGFMGAVYGYLHTEDATDLVIPAKGGEASIHVNPMLFSSDEEGNPAARIFIESIVENEEELEEVPEWLSLGIANEDYTTDADGYVIDPSFDLVAKAEALPAGVESRSCEIVFMQEGALLKVTVTQGQGESAAGPGAQACLSRVTDPEGRGYSLRPSAALRGQHAPLEPPLRAGLAAG